MADYTKLGLDEVKSILALYDLGEVIDIAPQGYGISNSNYKISLIGREPVLLKVSNDKNDLELLEEQKILDLISSNGFDLSLRPIRTKNNELIYKYEHFVGVVFPFINGEVADIGTHSISQIAEAVAKLHSLPFNTGGVRNHTDVGFDFQGIYDFVHKNLDCPEDFKTAFYSTFSAQKCQEILGLTLKKGLIHGDLYYDNCLFKDHELIKVLDFEQAGVGEFLLDIGISISGSCLNAGKIDQVLIDTFINSYEKINNIENKEFLYDFIHIGLFSIALWRIKRFFIGNLDETKKFSYRELIERSGSFEYSS